MFDRDVVHAGGAADLWELGRLILAAARNSGFAREHPRDTVPPFVKLKRVHQLPGATVAVARPLDIARSTGSGRLRCFGYHQAPKAPAPKIGV
jgi:hypothetical protein